MGVGALRQPPADFGSATRRGFGSLVLNHSDQPSSAFGRPRLTSTPLTNIPKLSG